MSLSPREMATMASEWGDGEIRTINGKHFVKDARNKVRQATTEDFRKQWMSQLGVPRRLPTSPLSPTAPDRYFTDAGSSRQNRYEYGRPSDQVNENERHVRRDFRPIPDTGRDAAASARLSARYGVTTETAGPPTQSPARETQAEYTNHSIGPVLGDLDPDPRQQFQVLSGSLREFMALSERPPERRAAFLQRYPEVLKSNLADVFKEAEYQMRSGNHIVAHQCISGMAIIRLCEDFRNSPSRIEARVLMLVDDEGPRAEQYRELVAAIKGAVARKAKEKQREFDPGLSFGKKPQRPDEANMLPSHAAAQPSSSFQAGRQFTAQSREMGSSNLGAPMKMEMPALDDALEHFDALYLERQVTREMETGPKESSDRDFRQLAAQYIVQPKPRKFFIPGRVFAMLWHEPAGSSSRRAAPGMFTSTISGNSADGINKTISPLATTLGPYGEAIYSQIRRMVVVRGREGHCWCISINTYGGQGLKKRGLKESEINAHAIIYDSTLSPQPFAGEPRSQKSPIAVHMVSQETLSRSSRLHYGKPFTVEYKNRVRNVGLVKPDCIQILLKDVTNELLGETS